MSIIHVNQIAAKIKELFADKIDISDITATGQEREEIILTRCLAAYGIYNQINCSIEDAAVAVTDGGNDNGIDALYFSPTIKEMIIVQSKWNKSGVGEPDSASVGKFCNGVKDLFNLSFERFNEKIQLKQTTVQHALGEYDTKYILVLIDTGDRGLAVHSERLIDDLLSEMNDAGEGIINPLVSFQRLNQAKIHSSLALSAGTAPIDLEIGLSQWGKVTEPHSAYFGIIAGEEIAQWWIDYGRRLFEKNIRQVLGSTEVNNEIHNTLKERPENFWYFNNGVTVVAEQIDKSMIGGSSRDHGTFKLQGAQIVNGAQTVSTMGRFFENGGQGLNKAFVGIRIISLKETPQQFGLNLTRANNRQNRIENRDFVSQDTEQMRIKTELAIDGVDYNIVRSDSFKPSRKAFDLQEATVALACASGQVNLAVQAKREIGKFFEDLSSSMYKTLFNPSTSGFYVYNCVQINREIEKFLEQNISELPRRSGRDYGLLVHANRIISLLIFNSLGLSEVAKKSNFVLDEESIKETTKSILENLTNYINHNYSDSILGTLFKNATKCRDIVGNCN